MWPIPQFPADLVTFTEEILNGKRHFLYCDFSTLPYSMERITWLLFSSTSLFTSNQILFPFALNSGMLALYRSFSASPVVLSLNPCGRIPFKPYFNVCSMISVATLMISEIICWFICSSISQISWVCRSALWVFETGKKNNDTACALIAQNVTHALRYCINETAGKQIWTYQRLLET